MELLKDTLSKIYDKNQILAEFQKFYEANKDLSGNELNDLVNLLQEYMCYEYIITAAKDYLLTDNNSENPNFFLIAHECLKLLSRFSDSSTLIDACEILLNLDENDYIALEYLFKVYMYEDPDNFLTNHPECESIWSRLSHFTNEYVSIQSLSKVVLAYELIHQLDYANALNALLDVYNDDTLDNGPEIFYYMALIYFRVHDLANADKILDEALALKEIPCLVYEAIFWENLAVLRYRIWLEQKIDCKRYYTKALTELLKIRENKLFHGEQRLQIECLLAICYSQLNLESQCTQLLDEIMVEYKNQEITPMPAVRGICCYNLGHCSESNKCLEDLTDLNADAIDTLSFPIYFTAHLIRIHLKIYEILQKLFSNNYGDNISTLAISSFKLLTLEHRDLNDLSNILDTYKTLQELTIITAKIENTLETLFSMSQMDTYNPYVYYLMAQSYLLLACLTFKTDYTNDFDDQNEMVDSNNVERSLNNIFTNPNSLNLLNGAKDLLERCCEIYQYHFFPANQLLANLLIELRMNDLYGYVLQKMVDVYENLPRDTCTSWLYRRLGILYLNKGFYEKSINSFTQVFHQDPNDEISWKCLAEAYYYNNSFKASLKAFQEHPIWKSNDVSNDNKNIGKTQQNTEELCYVNTKFAMLHFKMGSHSLAISAFQDILDRNPGYTLALMGLAETYIDLAEKSLENYLDIKATECVKNALEILLSNINVEKPATEQNLNGGTDEKISQQPKMAEWIKYWLLLSKGCCLLQTLPIYLNATKKDEIVPLITIAINNDNVKICVSYSFTLIDLMLINLKSLTIALQILPNNRGLWLKLFNALMLLVKMEAETKKLNLSCQPSPDLLALWKICPKLELRIPTSLKAADSLSFIPLTFRLLKTFIELHPNDPWAINILGILAVTTETKQESENNIPLQAFQRSIDIAPNEPMFASNLGILYLMKGEGKLANESFTKAQINDPKYPFSWMGQATLAEMLGHNLEEAIDLYQHTYSFIYNPYNILNCGKVLLKLYCLCASSDDTFLMSENQNQNHGTKKLNNSSEKVNAINNNNASQKDENKKNWENIDGTEYETLDLHQHFVGLRDRIRKDRVHNYTAIQLEAMVKIAARHQTNSEFYYVYVQLYLMLKGLQQPFMFYTPLHSSDGQMAFLERDIIYLAGKALTVFLTQNNLHGQFNVYENMDPTTNTNLLCEKYHNQLKIITKQFQTMIEDGAQTNEIKMFYKQLNRYFHLYSHCLLMGLQNYKNISSSISEDKLVDNETLLHMEVDLFLLLLSYIHFTEELNGLPFINEECDWANNVLLQLSISLFHDREKCPELQPQIIKHWKYSQQILLSTHFYKYMDTDDRITQKLKPATDAIIKRKLLTFITFVLATLSYEPQNLPHAFLNHTQIYKILINMYEPPTPLDNGQNTLVPDKRNNQKGRHLKKQFDPSEFSKITIMQKAPIPTITNLDIFPLIKDYYGNLAIIVCQMISFYINPNPFVQYQKWCSICKIFPQTLMHRIESLGKTFAEVLMGNQESRQSQTLYAKYLLTFLQGYMENCILQYTMRIPMSPNLIQSTPILPIEILEILLSHNQITCNHGYNLIAKYSTMIKESFKRYDRDAEWLITAIYLILGDVDSAFQFSQKLIHNYPDDIRSSLLLIISNYYHSFSRCPQQTSKNLRMIKDRLLVITEGGNALEENILKWFTTVSFAIDINLQMLNAENKINEQSILTNDNKCLEERYGTYMSIIQQTKALAMKFMENTNMQNEKQFRSFIHNDYKTFVESMQQKCITEYISPRTIIDDIDTYFHLQKVIAHHLVESVLSIQLFDSPFTCYALICLITYDINYVFSQLVWGFVAPNLKINMPLRPTLIVDNKPNAWGVKPHQNPQISNDFAPGGDNEKLLLRLNLQTLLAVSVGPTLSLKCLLEFVIPCVWNLITEIWIRSYKKCLKEKVVPLYETRFAILLNDFNMVVEQIQVLYAATSDKNISMHQSGLEPVLSKINTRQEISQGRPEIYLESHTFTLLYVMLEVSLFMLSHLKPTPNYETDLNEFIRNLYNHTINSNTKDYIPTIKDMLTL